MNNRKKLTIGVVVVVVVAAIVATGAVALSNGSSSNGSSSTKPVVKTGRVLGGKALVNQKGFTLYSLSAETHGRFICTDKTCMSLWTPLTVARGTKPTGAARLATVRRPDGRTQVTYKGKPLYTFVEDKQAGQAKGEGFKDVGTWHVARAAAAGGNTPSSQPMNQGYGSY